LQKNGPCKPNVKEVAAVTGPNASNHLIGLAIDFRLDVPCGDKNGGPKEKQLYDQCTATSKYFKFLVKYAPEFLVKNLDNEPWHWSYNGR
jgi:LAS superfamily LD-carboxypeptidase LdcB